jgi:hypothetical protein
MDSNILFSIIRERLDSLTIEKWRDGGDFEEIRDKDYVADCIVLDVLEHIVWRG